MQKDQGKKAMKKGGCIACGCVFGIFGFVGGIIWLTTFTNFCAGMMGVETYPLKANPNLFDVIAAVPDIRERVGRNAILTEIDLSSVRPDGTQNLYADYSPAPTANLRFQLPLDKDPDGKTAPPVGAGRGPDDVWVQAVTVRCYQPGQRRHVSRISGGSSSSFSYINEGMDLDRSSASMQKLKEGITKFPVTPKQMWEIAKKLGAREDSVATIRINENGSDFNITGTGINLCWDEAGKLEISSLKQEQREKLGLSEED